MKKRTHILVFEGRVLPEILGVGIKCPDPFEYADPDGMAGVFSLSISDGKVKVSAKLANLDENTKQWAVVRGHELVTSIIDLYAFTLGYALHVIIDFTIENGQKKPFILSHTSVKNFIEEFSDDQFEQLIEHVIADLDLKLALRDLVLSLSTMNYSAIAACRSTEAIRNYFRENDETDAQAWERMRTCLNLSREYIQYITDASKKPRHGHRGAALLSDQSEITHRAWLIMNRYMCYLLEGSPTTLSISQHPKV